MTLRRTKLTQPLANYKKIVYISNYFIILLTILFTYNSKAQAIVSTQIGYAVGQNSSFKTTQQVLKQYELSKVKTDILSLKVTFNPPIPSPFFDIGIGLAVSKESYKLPDYKDELSFKMSSFSGGPLFSVLVSFPLVPISPMLRVQGTSSGINFTSKNKSYELDLPNLKSKKVSYGYKYALGIDISPLPVVSFFIEYEWSHDYVKLKAKQEVISYLKHYDQSSAMNDLLEINYLKYKIYRSGFNIGVKAGI